MAAAQAILTKWVFVGAGPAHCLTLKKLIKKKPPGIDIVVINDQLEVPDIGLLPGFIAGSYKSDEIYTSVAHLVEKLGGKMIQASLKSLDCKSKKLKLSNDEEIDYDLLSFDPGAEIHEDVIPGAQEFSHFLKPIPTYHRAILRFCQSLRGKRKVYLAFIGANPLGVECALALRQRLKLYGADVFVSLIDSDLRIVSYFSESVSSSIARHCESLGIEIHTDIRVKEIKASEVILANGKTIKSDFTSITNNDFAPEILLSSGLEHNQHFLLVNQHLQTSDKHVFALGDIAIDPSFPKWTLHSHKRAEKQSKILYMNLRAMSLQLKLKKYRPVKRELTLMLDGEGRALGVKGGIYLSPRAYLWKIKDWLDVKFLKSLDTDEKSPGTHIDSGKQADPSHA